MDTQLKPEMGIVSLFEQYPALAASLSQLAETLLRGPSPLSPGQREVIAAYTSMLNYCNFCFHTHVFAAEALLNDNTIHQRMIVTASYFSDADNLERSLLIIVQHVVHKSTPETLKEAITVAKHFEATDEMIHHTVAIAAAFCMFNRYVDGLNPMDYPSDVEPYREMGKMLAEKGYLLN